MEEEDNDQIVVQDPNTGTYYQLDQVQLQQFLDVDGNYKIPRNFFSQILQDDGQQAVKEESDEEDCEYMEDALGDESDLDDVSTDPSTGQSTGQSAGQSTGQLSCDHCGRLFTSIIQLTEHMETHTTERKPKIEVINQRFYCETCEKSFAFRKDLVFHQRVHTNEKPHLCNVCGQSFDRVMKLNRHKITSHNIDDPIQVGRVHVCSVCDRKFKDIGNFKKHMATHMTNSEKPFHCSSCEKSFRTDADLYAHSQRWHSGTNCRYVCDVCDRAYKLISVLKTHLKSKCHAERAQQLLDTAQASQRTDQMERANCIVESSSLRYNYPDEDELDDDELDNGLCRPSEINEAEPQADEVVVIEGHTLSFYDCRVCGARFCHKDDFVAHDRRHRDYRPEACTQCARRFVNARELDAHRLAKHSPFECEICHQLFPQKNTLVKHVQQVHMCERKYRCSVCGLGCIAPETLRRHYMRKHTSDSFRPFTCTRCPKGFKTLHDLKRHYKSHLSNASRTGPKRVNPSGRAPKMRAADERSAKAASAFEIEQRRLRRLKASEQRQRNKVAKKTEIDGAALLEQLRGNTGEVIPTDPTMSAENSSEAAPLLFLNAQDVDLTNVLELEPSRQVAALASNAVSSAFQHHWICVHCTEVFDRQPLLMEHIRRVHEPERGSDDDEEEEAKVDYDDTSDVEDELANLTEDQFSLNRHQFEIFGENQGVMSHVERMVSLSRRRSGAGPTLSSAELTECSGFDEMV